MNIGKLKERFQQSAVGVFVTKFSKDNVGALGSIVAWSLLTSLVPILVGLVAIAGLVLQANPSAESTVVRHLSQALQGALSTRDISEIVKTSTQHAGLLGIIAFIGVLWGGANVGGAISTAFQAIFETDGRNFVKEKVIDMGMIFIFAALMLIIIAATTAGAILERLVSGFPLSGVGSFVIGSIISLVAALLLFAAIYLVFPNAEPRFKLRNVWRGALLAAVLFQILSYVWPIYAHFSHFSRYGSVLFTLLVLTAWLYFFSMIMLVGAEVVATGAIRESQAEGRSVGPAPKETVPQHRVLRNRAS
jgi:membrane protein